MSIQFYTFSKSPRYSSFSPYCQKLETFFRATKTPYEIKVVLPSKAPKGQLPFVKCASDPNGLGDSYFVINRLVETKQVPDLDTLAGLTPLQVVDARSWVVYIENLTLGSLTYLRWVTPSGWALTKPQVFGSLPWFIRPIIAWKVHRGIVKRMMLSNIGRHSESEIKGFLREFRDLLVVRLENAQGMYLFGDKPTVADCVTYAALTCMLGRGAIPYAQALVLENTVVREYIALCTRSWFPEYELLLDLVERQ